jgi:hypothetical protein
MKLVLQLATMTAEYTLSGVPTMQYEGDCVYIIENNNVTIEAPKQKPMVVPAEVITEPVTPEQPVEVAKVIPLSTSSGPKPASVMEVSESESVDDNVYIQRMYAFTKSEEMKRINGALKNPITPGDMDNIIAAVELAASSCISFISPGRFKLESIVVACMFLVAKYDYHKAVSTLSSINSCISISRYVMRAIIRPNSATTNNEFYEVLNSLLKPYLDCELNKRYNARLHVKSHFDDALDAMRAGYSNAAISRKYKISQDVLSRIRRGADTRCPPNETYPIPTSNDWWASTVKCCKCCGCAIPVKRVSATKGKADTCIDCKNKLEKEEKLRRTNG